jgi:hypothetical protein
MAEHMSALFSGGVYMIDGTVKEYWLIGARIADYLMNDRLA